MCGVMCVYVYRVLYVCIWRVYKPECWKPWNSEKSIISFDIKLLVVVSHLL